MMTRRTRDNFKKIAEDKFSELNEGLINEEVIDFAQNIYGTLNLISAKYSPDSVVDLIPIIICILNRLDATLKVNSDLTSAIQEVCEENSCMKKTLHSEKLGRKRDFEESLSYEEKTEEEIASLGSKLKQLDFENNVLTEKLKSKNTIIDLLISDISKLTKQTDAFTTGKTDSINNANNNEFYRLSKKKNNTTSRSTEAISSFETPNRFKELFLDESPNVPGSTIEVEAEVHTEYCNPTVNKCDTGDDKVSSMNCSGKKITMLADSHGRGLLSSFRKHIKDFNSFVLSKPGAKLKQVLSGCKKWIHGFSQWDYLVVFGGTNDFGPQEPYQLTIRQGLNELFALNTQTNVIIIDVPYRHDSPNANNNIFFINQTIKNMIKNYNGKTSFFHFQINDFLKRKHYTRHGLHLNKAGKSLVVEVLSDLIQQKSRSTISKAVQPNEECDNIQSTGTEHKPAERPMKQSTQLHQVATSPDITCLPSNSPEKDSHTMTSHRLPATLYNISGASANLQQPATPVHLPIVSHRATTSYYQGGMESPQSDYSSVDSEPETSLVLNDLQSFPPLPPPGQHLQACNNTEQSLNNSVTNVNLDFLFHVQPVQRVT